MRHLLHYNLISIDNHKKRVIDLAQSTDYYAYGAPHGDALYAEANRRKFGGKEYLTEFGLDEYDFCARRLDPRLGHFTTPDPLASQNPSISPWAYCNGDPVNLIDPTGQMVIFSRSGEYLGHSLEGYTGQVYIYDGNEKIDFSKFSEAEILNNYPFDIKSFDTLSVTGSEMLSGNAMSKIWTSIVGHFEGLKVYDETFSLSSIPGEKIGYSKPTGKAKNAQWFTSYDNDCIPTGIKGTGILNYEPTVENIASSVIVHEWYSHMIKGVGNRHKSHRLAYKNIINYKKLWNRTTDSYKSFVMDGLLRYTEIETGRTNVDALYRRLYNKYVK